MSEISNMNELRVAMKQMEIEAAQKSLAIKQHISAIRESMRPANMLAAAYNKIAGGGEMNYERRHSFSINIIKAGLALWLRKGLFKAESKIEHKVYDVIDSAFDRIKDFLRKRV